MNSMYIVVNPKDTELCRGFDKDGCQKFIRDHLMILDDHADYRVKIYELKPKPLLDAQGKQLHDATFVTMATPEQFIKEA